MAHALPDVAGKAVRDNRRSTFVWSAGLAALTGLQLAVYPALRGQAAELTTLLNSYPAGLKAFFDVQADFATGLGFLAGESFGLMVPLALLALAISQGAAATAREEEHGTLDLMLASAIPRSSVVLGKATAGLTSVVIAAVVLFVTVAIGDVAVGLNVGVAQIAAGVAAAAVLACSFGSAAMFVGTATGRRGLGLAFATWLALLSYLLDSLATITDALRPWQWMSLFHQLSPSDALRQGVNGGGMLVGLLVTAVFIAAAVIAFNRRDLRT